MAGPAAAGGPGLQGAPGSREIRIRKNHVLMALDHKGPCTSRGPERQGALHIKGPPALHVKKPCMFMGPARQGALYIH